MLYKYIIRISTFLLYQCMYVCIVIIYSEGKAELCKVAIPARGQMDRGTQHFPVPVRAQTFGLARQFGQSRPASACSSPYSD